MTDAAPDVVVRLRAALGERVDTSETARHAARHDGGACLGRDAERLLDVLDRAGVNDGEGETGCRVPGLISTRGVARRLGRVDALAECRAQAPDVVVRLRAASVTRSGAVPR